MNCPNIINRPLWEVIHLFQLTLWSFWKCCMSKTSTIQDTRQNHKNHNIILKKSRGDFVDCHSNQTFWLFEEHLNQPIPRWSFDNTNHSTQLDQKNNSDRGRTSSYIANRPPYFHEVILLKYLGLSFLAHSDWFSGRRPNFGSGNLLLSPKRLLQDHLMKIKWLIIHVPAVDSHARLSSRETLLHQLWGTRRRACHQRQTRWLWQKQWIRSCCRLQERSFNDHQSWCFCRC